MRASIRQFTRGSGTAALCGAFFTLAATSVSEEVFRGREIVGALLFGAAIGLMTLALLRLFAPRSFAHLIAGTLSGPVPFLVLMGAQTGLPDRGGLVALGLILGFFIGACEWARARPLAQNVG